MATLPRMERSGVPTSVSPAYDDDIVRLFFIATVVWALVGMLVGVIIALLVRLFGLSLRTSLLTGVVLALRAGRPLTALVLVLAFAGADLSVRLGWSLWGRPRPDLVFGGEAAPGFHAFPSGHSGKTVVVWGLLAVLWIRASPSTGERRLVGGPGVGCGPRRRARG